jgi:hypothetical protein
MTHLTLDNIDIIDEALEAHCEQVMIDEGFNVDSVLQYTGTTGWLLNARDASEKINALRGRLLGEETTEKEKALKLWSDIEEAGLEPCALYYPSTFTLELFGYDDRRDFLDSLRDPIAHARIDSTDELDDITIHTVTLSDEIPTSLGLTCA